jgi:hypothetical protein
MTTGQSGKKKEASSTLVLPAIRTLCLFNDIQNFCWYRGRLTVDAGNALEMLLQELVFLDVLVIFVK